MGNENTTLPPNPRQQGPSGGKNGTEIIVRILLHGNDLNAGSESESSFTGADTPVPMWKIV